MALTGFTTLLTWRDFPANVPANADSGTGAFVSTSFGAQAPWTYTGNGAARVYTIGSVSCSVGLNRARMWARPGASRTASLLVHEQGHFEISALIMRQVDRELSALIGIGYSSETEVNEAIASVRNPLFTLIANLQSSATGDGEYDVSTNHGMNSTQSNWNRAFSACRADPTGELQAALATQGITV